MLPADDAVEAYGTSSGGAQPQIGEAVEDRDFAAVGQRPEVDPDVHSKICDGHLPAQEERDRTGEQTQNDQRSAKGFKDSSRAHHGSKFCLLAAESTERAKEFLIP